MSIWASRKTRGWQKSKKKPTAQFWLKTVCAERQGNINEQKKKEDECSIKSPLLHVIQLLCNCGHDLASEL